MPQARLEVMEHFRDTALIGDYNDEFETVFGQVMAHIDIKLAELNWNELSSLDENVFSAAKAN